MPPSTQGKIESRLEEALYIQEILPFFGAKLVMLQQDAAYIHQLSRIRIKNGKRDQPAAICRRKLHILHLWTFPGHNIRPEFGNRNSLPIFRLSIFDREALTIVREIVLPDPVRIPEIPELADHRLFLVSSQSAEHQR